MPTAAAFTHRGQPVISVDTKKKELVGDFKNGGREWQPQGEPELVDVHDFPSDAIGKAIPYGVYDVAANDDDLFSGAVAKQRGRGVRIWRLADGRRRSFHAPERLAGRRVDQHARLLLA